LTTRGYQQPQRVSYTLAEKTLKTLKYEWLKRVPIIKGFDHLTRLCSEFEQWYNTWRPHTTVDGFRPDDVYYGRQREKPPRNAKTLPRTFVRHVFKETCITGYRLKDVA
jgi:transposase InsO family protein